MSHLTLVKPLPPAPSVPWRRRVVGSLPPLRAHKWWRDWAGGLWAYTYPGMHPLTPVEKFFLAGLLRWCPVDSN